MVKHTKRNCWLLQTNCLSVFNHFAGLVLKGLSVCLRFAGIFLVEIKKIQATFNSSLTNATILYSLKTLENLWFSGVFRGYKMGTLARNRFLVTLE